MPAKPKPVAAAEWIHIDRLMPWDQNPRHNEGAAWEVARSITEVGWGAPIVAQAGTMRIVAGHARHKAALLLRYHQWDAEAREWVTRDDPWQLPGAPEPDMVPVRVMDIDDRQATQLTIADNKLGELAEWDTAALEGIIRDLGTVPDTEEVDLSDMAWLGFREGELDSMFGEPAPAPPKTPVRQHGRKKPQDKRTITVVVSIDDGETVAAVVRAALEEKGFEFAMDIE